MGVADCETDRVLVARDEDGTWARGVEGLVVVGTSLMRAPRIEQAQRGDRIDVLVYVLWAAVLIALLRYL